jgi:hypothetical protein
MLKYAFKVIRMSSVEGTRRQKYHECGLNLNLKKWIQCVLMIVV